MSKRKRFVISQSLERGLSETINAVKNNAGSVRFEVVSLSRIETDPENPRELSITSEEIRQGLNKTDNRYQDKVKEYENLQQLAETIRKKGLINPVVVYKHHESYRLVAGERRFLASLIAGRDDIQARILNEKPNNFDLRLLQWIENTEREDLSLKDRIGNVKAISQAYLKDHPDVEVTATLLKELIGISLPQATCYVSILKAPSDVVNAINSGNVNNLDKAAYIAKISSAELRKKAIESCTNGSNLKQLRGLVEQEKITKKNGKSMSVSTKRGRVATRINLGITSKATVVKNLVNLVLKQQQYQKYAIQFDNIDWNKFDQASQAFQKIVKILETEGVV